MTTREVRDARLDDIRDRPWRHQHSFDELQTCCFVDGGIDTGLLAAHERVVPGGSRGKCDVVDGPCACGSWHDANARKDVSR